MIVILICGWLLSTGYECGFFGFCEDPKEWSFYGTSRLIATIVIVYIGLPIICAELFISKYRKKITIHIPKIKNPFKDNFGPDHPDWEEYQEWLKTRDK